jgi:hypothetical protein
MATGVFDARFDVSFGWDCLRKCWVVQVREGEKRRMLMKRDVHTSSAMSQADVKRILGAIASEMESWLPW